MINRKNVRHFTAGFMAVILSVSMLFTLCETSVFVQAEESGINESEACRLIVTTEDAGLLEDNSSVLAEHDGVYLLQFENAEEAEKVSGELSAAENTDVEKDTMFTVAYDEKDSEFLTSDSVMTVDENPISELEELLKKDEENMDSEAAVSESDYDIALIDTGASVGKNVLKAVSVIGDETDDDNGHGTRMAELMSEQDSDAGILSIKALDANGRGDLSAVYAAMEYAISSKVKIINLSISAKSADDSSILSSEIKKARDAGIWVVGAAGNNGADVKDYIPGNITNAIIVGACDSEGARIGESNYGDTVDLYVNAGSTSEASATLSGIVSLALRNGADDLAAAVFENENVFKNKENEMAISDSGNYEDGTPVYFLFPDEENYGLEDGMTVFDIAGEEVECTNTSGVRTSYYHPDTATGNVYNMEVYTGDDATLWCVDSCSNPVAGTKYKFNLTDVKDQDTINYWARVMYYFYSNYDDWKAAIYWQTWLWDNNILGLEESWGDITLTDSDLEKGYQDACSSMVLDSNVTGSGYIYSPNDSAAIDNYYGQAMMYLEYHYTNPTGWLSIKKYGSDNYCTDESVYGATFDVYDSDSKWVAAFAIAGDGFGYEIMKISDGGLPASNTSYDNKSAYPITDKYNNEWGWVYPYNDRIELPTGTYTIKESAPPVSGKYWTAADQEITISADNTYEYPYVAEFVEQRATGWLSIKKYGSDNYCTDESVYGATFDVYDSDSKWVAAFAIAGGGYGYEIMKISDGGLPASNTDYSNKSSYPITDKYNNEWGWVYPYNDRIELPTGTYTIKESAPPVSGNYLTAADQEITISADNTYEYPYVAEFVEQRVTGYLSIQKYGSDNNCTDESVYGAVFGVYNGNDLSAIFAIGDAGKGCTLKKISEGGVPGSNTSYEGKDQTYPIADEYKDEWGWDYADKVELPTGTYTVKELAAPVSGKYLTAADQTVTVTKDNIITVPIRVEFTDQSAVRDIAFSKTVVNENGNLILSKTAAGDGDISGRIFYFTATSLLDSNAKSVSGTYKRYYANGTLRQTGTITQGGKIQLLSGEYAVISLPAGTYYTFTEDTDLNYYATPKSVSGVIDSVSISTSFNFLISGLPSGSFTYHIYDSSTNEQVGGDHSIANNYLITLSGGQYVVIEKIPIGTTVTVKEIKKSDSKWSVNQESASLTVTSDGGETQWLTGFINRYKPADVSSAFTNESGAFEVRKIVENNPGVVKVQKNVKLDTTNGRTSDNDYNFEYTLTCAQSCTYTRYKADGTVIGSKDVSISNGGKFYLKNGEYVLVSIPAGADYSIEETDKLTDSATQSGDTEHMYTITSTVTGLTTDGSTLSADGRRISGSFTKVSNTSRMFKLTFTVADDSGKAVSGVKLPYTGTNGRTTVNAASTTDSKGQFSIFVYGGADLTFIGLASNYNVSVSEASYSNYTTKIVDNSGAAADAKAAIDTDTKLFTITNTYTPDPVEAVFTNTPDTAPAKICKKVESVADSTQLIGNNRYSQDLMDAVFKITVYDGITGTQIHQGTYNPTSYDAATMTAEFSINDWQLYVGDKVVIQEITPPKGYLLPSDVSGNADDNVWTIDALSHNVSENTASFEDKLGMDNIEFKLYKSSTSYIDGKLVIETEDGNPVAADGSNVKAVYDEEENAGAVFLVAYYDVEPDASGNYDITGKSPVRYWYFMSNENGYWAYSTDYLMGVSNGKEDHDFDSDIFTTDGKTTYQLPSGFKWGLQDWNNDGKSDTGDLYWLGLDSGSPIVDTPIGYYTVQEVWSPKGYQIVEDKSGNLFTFKGRVEKYTDTKGNTAAEFHWITTASDIENNTTGTIRSFNGGVVIGDTPVSIAIEKLDKDTVEHVSGASFKITDRSDADKTYEFTTSADEEIHIVLEFLELGHSYVLEETDFPDGYVLNEDKIYFDVDLEANITFRDVTHILEDGNEITYSVKERTKSTGEAYEASYDIIYIDKESGKQSTGENGIKTCRLVIPDEPNEVDFTKLDEHGNAMAGVEFEVCISSLGNDTTKVIGYYDEEHTRPFYNHGKITTDADGRAVLYRLLRSSEYVISETKTLEGNTLLADVIKLSTNEKGRILGTHTEGRTIVSGSETRQDGMVNYDLRIVNNTVVTLRTGGRGRTLIYTIGGSLLFAAVIFLLAAVFRRKKREEE